jgi:hypothetical protein
MLLSLSNFTIFIAGTTFSPSVVIISEKKKDKVKIITSELLELAQHAEEENNELQQMMFKDASQNESNLCVSTDFRDTATKIVELQPESENDNRSNEERDFLSVKSVDNQESSSDVIFSRSSSCIIEKSGVSDSSGNLSNRISAFSFGLKSVISMLLSLSNFQKW